MRVPDDHEVSGLAGLTAPDPAVLARLHRRLEQGAEQEGLLDVAYTTVDSPLGPLLLAATERGLVRVAFESEGLDEVLDVLGRKLSPRVLRAPRRLDRAAFEVEEYFGHRRTEFGLPLDLSLSAGFRQAVQAFLPRIRYGTTTSYGQVAAQVGNPRAVRAVGTACSTNPLPIVLPCHRVLRASGALGGYIGGLAAKTALLELEAPA